MDMSEHGALVHLLLIFLGQSRDQPLCSNRIQKLVEEKVQMVMSEYEKQHKEKMEKLDDLEKQEKEKLENFDLIVQKYRTEMVRHGIPNPSMNPIKSF